MDDFGDRMKAYESCFTSQTISPDQWMCVRIDGKKFSKFTKDFIKPFDPVITDVMIHTTKQLVRLTHATIGYTQSDEITLLYAPSESQRIFGGKTSKINSVFASMATAHFNSYLPMIITDIVWDLAYFDCRVWEVPSGIEAFNTLLWRAQDARKNSISAFFRWTAGHKAMHGLNGDQMRRHLEARFGVDWNNLPACWKYGTYVKPVVRAVILTPDQIAKIPVDKRTGIADSVLRTSIEVVDVGDLNSLPYNQRMAFLSKSGENDDLV